MQHFHTLSWLSISLQIIESFDMVYSSAVCGALSFMTTNQIRLSIFSMPCDCWKDLMKAIFGFPATVSEIDDDVEICSEFHIPAPFRLLFLS